MPAPAPVPPQPGLLVGSALTSLLGLGLIGASLWLPETRLERTTTAPFSRTMRSAPDRQPTPSLASVRISNDPECPRAPADQSLLQTGASTGTDDDPRAFLSTMQAGAFRHPVSTIVAQDPYLASLNPAVYLPLEYTPITRAEQPDAAQHDQICE